MLPDLLSKLLKTFLLHEPSCQALERDSFFNYANTFLNGNTLESNTRKNTLLTDQRATITTAIVQLSIKVTSHHQNLPLIELIER